MVQINVVTTPFDVPAGALVQAERTPPPTDQLILESSALGATPAAPVTVAVKVRVAGSPPELVLVRTTVGVTLAIESVVAGVEVTVL